MVKNELIFASFNNNKILEMQTLLAPHNITVYGAQKFGLPDVEETGLTFAENAELKSKSAAVITKLPALSDDSGLMINALNGKPGIYSARFIKECGSYDMAFAKLQEMLEDTQDFSAQFISVLAFSEPINHNKELQVKTTLFEGVVEGNIVFPPRGQNRFGYDPIFQPLEYKQTFGEMPKAQKNTMSHRYKALQLFLQYWQTR